MRCRDFRRQYSTYRDGTDPALVAEMEDHLAACPDCTAYDKAVSDGVDMLRGTRLRPSPDFRNRLNARIASGEVVPEPVPPHVSPWAATAAALVLATLLVFTIRQSTDVPPVAAAEKPAVLARPQMIPGIPFVAFRKAP
ncbi:MAG TPA: zf-HC2 domain-containing protein [Gemmatimonadales bacterium]|nr:zf-HC2 domain-containing protein [Gemmatimonadales bacterium]